MSKQQIQTTVTKNKKTIPPTEELGFGQYFTDHMFVVDYTEEDGWYNARIEPYAPIELDPAASILHYGQTIFEGLKAYVTPEGQAQIFRPEENIKRLNLSCERLSMPQIDEGFLLDATKKLVALDQNWIPKDVGTALYIRPFVFATQPTLNVVPANAYKLMIILSPVGPYYPEGMNPVKLAVESEYVRAVQGGTGEAKTGGNYAGSFRALEDVSKDGYSQVLWLDAIERKYVEEAGAMNVFFKIDGEVITPSLSGSILHGVTRKSIIQLLKHWEIPISERRISIDEVYEAHENGTLEEAFCAGTAAVISPIGQLRWKNKEIQINDFKIGNLSQEIYDTLTGIQYGTKEDIFNWMTKVQK